jgi:hypothetical protein
MMTSIFDLGFRFTTIKALFQENCVRTWMVPLFIDMSLMLASNVSVKASSKNRLNVQNFMIFGDKS